MKILFVNVSRNWNGRVYQEYPLGVGILATIAAAEGFEVEVLDMAVDHRPAEQVVRSSRPDVIALSFLSTSSATALALLRSLAGMGAAHIVAGGIHTSLFPEIVLGAGAHVCVIGEGEPPLIPLLKALRVAEVGRYRPEQLKHVPNLLFRDTSGNLVRTDNCPESVSLGDLPIVRRDLFDLPLYRHHSLITSRGCPFDCYFCCCWGPGGRRGRSVSPRRAMAELEYLAEQFGPQTVYWADEIFFFRRDARMEMCNLLRESKLPIQWVGQVRADTLEPPLLAALPDTGCVKVCIGAESGSDAILQAINKKCTVAQTESAIRACASHGLRVKTWWILGLPGGNYEDQLRCLDSIDRARPHEVAIHTFVPLPGTTFWNRAPDFGIGRPAMEDLEQLYYYSDPRAIKLDYLSPDDLGKAIQTCAAALEQMGYKPTDRATESDTYVYTSPLCQTTFGV